MIRWLIALLTFILFEIFLVFFVDRSLAETVRAYGADHPAVIDFFRSYTDFGKSKWALWPTGLAMIIMAIDLNRQNVTLDYKARFRKASESCLFVFLCVAASGLLTDAIKPFVGRARPVLLGREEIYGFDPISFQAAWNSMPSER